MTLEQSVNKVKADVVAVGKMSVSACP